MYIDTLTFLLLPKVGQTLCTIAHLKKTSAHGYAKLMVFHFWCQFQKVTWDIFGCSVVGYGWGPGVKRIWKQCVY